MYQRMALNRLRSWAVKNDRKPLIIRGARQVGKTTLVNIFAKEFDQYIYLNLELPVDRSPFVKFTDISTLLQTVFLQKNVHYDKDKSTLIFIDEIQEAPEALQLLRYFYEQVPNIHIIGAGSLLESLFNIQASFPVGRVEYLVIRPVSFIEFLLAIGETVAFEELHNIPLNDYAAEKLVQLFHKYALIGGMPEIVKNYSEHNNVTELGIIYNSLLTSYSDDVEKYATNNAQVQYIRHAIQTVFPEAGNRIKFEGFGRSNYKSREMSEALRTLEKAMLINLVYPQTGTTLPLLPDKKRYPRLQVLDTGLMNFTLGIQKDIIGTENLDNVYKGIMLEHLIGQELLSEQYDSLTGLHFWVREKSTATAELDYIVSWNGLLIPIEVKSGATGTLRSLHQFMDLAPHQMAIRLYAGKLSIDAITTPTGKEFFLLNLPYFLAAQVKQYLPWFEQEIGKYTG